MLSTIYIMWSESFRFFFTPEFRLYFLLIANTTIRSTKIFIRYFFWTLPLLAFIILSLNPELDSIQNKISIYGLIATTSLISSIIILVARPSLEPKTLFYFLYYLPMTLLSKFFFSLIQGTFILLEPKPFMRLLAGSGLLFSTLSIFFFLDAECSIKNFFHAFLQATKMLIYFLPLFILYCSGIAAFFAFSSPLLLNTLNKISPPLLVDLFETIYEIVRQLFIISTLSVLYISLKHRYFKLFFTS